MTLRVLFWFVKCCTVVLARSSWALQGSGTNLYKTASSLNALTDRQEPKTLWDMNQIFLHQKPVLTDRQEPKTLWDMNQIFLHQKPLVGNDMKQAIRNPNAKWERQTNRVHRAPEVAAEIRQHAASMILGTFMPGYTFHAETGLSLLLMLGLASAWFTFYFHYLYKSDRSSKFEHWSEMLRDWRQSEDFFRMTLESEQQESADVVLVFHHPDFPHECQDQMVTKEDIMSCLQKQDVANIPNATHLAEYIKGFSQEQERAEACTMKDARLAFLLDMYAKLQEWGCNVEIYMTATRSEILLCASFTNQEAIQHYISHHQLSFQLQHSLIGSLDVEHPHEEICSTPPAVPFNPLHVKVLHNAGVIENHDTSLVYRCYGKQETGKLLRSVDRIRAIVDELLHVFDLEAAKKHGFVLDWYPVHDNRSGLAKLKVCWSNHRLLLDLANVQPIISIRNYFGDRAAFIFAWYGTWSKSLLVLLSATTCLWIVVTLMIFSGYDPARASTVRVIGGSCILVIWSRMASNTWKRDSSFFKVLFDDCRNDGHIAVRPQFIGHPRPAPKNLKLTEMHYPAWRMIIRRSLSYLTILIYSAFAASVISGVIHKSVVSNRGSLSLWANLTIAILLRLFKFIYDWIAYYTTEFENHKFYHSYYNSYLWKLVFFGFVNHYVPFLQLAFMQGSGTGVPCPEQGCISALQDFVNTTLVLIGVCHVAEVAFFTSLANHRMWVNKKEHDSSRQEGNIAWVEQQSKLPKHEKMSEIDSVIDIVFALGFVLIFGAVAIGTVLICYVVFRLQVCSRAYLLTTSTQRIVPETTLSGVVQARDDVVKLIITIGVLFEGFLIVTYDESFAHAAPITKLMGILIFWSLALVTWKVVDLYYPPTDSETELLEGRRKHTLVEYMKRTGQLVSSHHEIVKAPRQLSIGEVKACPPMHEVKPLTPREEATKRAALEQELMKQEEDDDQFEVAVVTSSPTMPATLGVGTSPQSDGGEDDDDDAPPCRLSSVWRIEEEAD